MITRKAEIKTALKVAVQKVWLPAELAYLLRLTGNKFTQCYGDTYY
jgi:hypothetical protein